MLKNSKIKLDLNRKEEELVKKKTKKPEVSYGIPDGSDSEISDFEVEGGKEGGKDDEYDEDEEEDEEDDEGLFDENGDVKEEDIDSDEVDEDLVDLYNDLGDEKEIMGIGKATKSFDQIDFDREDFGMNDDEDELPDEGDFDNELEEDEKDFIEKQIEEGKKNKAGEKSKDLFGQASGDEEKEDPTAGKSTFEIRQMKVSYLQANFRLVPKRNVQVCF